MNSAEVYFNKGIECNKNKQWDEALTHFNKAIEIDPDHADSYYHRGAAYYWKGMIDEALSDCGKSIELNPSNTEAYYSKGRVCEETNRISEAVEAYKNFLEKASPDKHDKQIKSAKRRLVNLDI